MTARRLTGLTLWLAGAALALGTGTALARPGNGPMARLDTNHDGKVSRQEWLAAAQRRFDAMDTNHDGVLDRQELQQARSAMRERFRQRWQQHQQAVARSGANP